VFLNGKPKRLGDLAYSLQLVVVEWLVTRRQTEKAVYEASLLGYGETTG
jgi:hypothetical protein